MLRNQVIVFSFFIIFSFFAGIFSLDLICLQFFLTHQCLLCFCVHMCRLNIHYILCTIRPCGPTTTDEQARGKQWMCIYIIPLRYYMGLMWMNMLGDHGGDLELLLLPRLFCAYCRSPSVNETGNKLC